MSDTDALLAAAADRARALFRERRPDAAARLGRAFRRDITAFGFDATRVLDRLGVPHRAYARVEHLPGRVVVIAAGSWDKNIPSEEVVLDLLARGGTLVVAGDALPNLGAPGAVRFEGSIYPDEAGDLGAWAEKLCCLLEAIGDAL